jgi:signal transduction histidine kinase
MQPGAPGNSASVSRDSSAAWLWLIAALALIALTVSLVFIARPAFAGGPLPMLLGALSAFIALTSLVVLARARRVGDATASSQPNPQPAAQAAEAPAAMVRELESLRAMQRELVAARQEAEAATMAKGEFLATMSHEIRTPPNGIVPLLDLLRSTPLRADQRDYLATAHQSALELLRIVDDILDYS